MSTIDETRVSARRPADGEAPVPLLRLPDDDLTRARLAARGEPRILVVAQRERPPVTSDPMEDWVREPVDLDEVQIRRAVLRRRHRDRGGGIVRDNGVLRFGDRWLALSDRQWAIVGPLVARAGQPQDRAELLDAYASAGGTADRDSFRSVVSRLGRKLATVGLRLHGLSDGRLLLQIVDPAPRADDASAGALTLDDALRAGLVHRTAVDTKH